MTWRLGSPPPAAADARGPFRQSVSAAPARRRRFAWDWLYGLPLTGVLGVLVFVCVLALHEPQLQHRLARPEPTAAPSGLRPDWAADFPDRIAQISDALTRLPLALPRPIEEPQGSGKVRWRHRRYEVSIPAPDRPGAIEDLVAPLRTVAHGVSVRVTEHATGAQVVIGVDGLLTHTLALQWLGRRPRTAIIVTDLGGNLLPARELAEVDAPLTFAVAPFAPFSTEVAELARMFGRQVLVQLPLTDHLGPDDSLALRASATQVEIRNTLNQSLAALPKAVGANALTSSALIADRERMHWLLERLKEDALFFVDGQADASSVACTVAAEIALPCIARDLEVESTADEHAIATQLERLGEIARIRGDAIAIVHPGAATAAGLKTGLSALAAAGVDVVPASMIVLDASLSKR